MQSKQDDSNAVTLITKDGKEIMASKTDLSAMSDFFTAQFNNEDEGEQRGNHSVVKRH